MTYPFFYLVLLGLVEVILVKEFGQGYSRALTKALYGDDLRAFRSFLEQIVNRRGRHSAAQRDIAYITVLLFADFFYSLDNSIVQFHSAILPIFLWTSTIIIGK